MAPRLCGGVRAFFNAKRANTSMILNNHISSKSAGGGWRSALNLRDHLRSPFGVHHIDTWTTTTIIWWDTSPINRVFIVHACNKIVRKVFSSVFKYGWIIARPSEHAVGRCLLDILADDLERRVRTGAHGFPELVALIVVSRAHMGQLDDGHIRVSGLLYHQQIR